MSNEDKPVPGGKLLWGTIVLIILAIVGVKTLTGRENGAGLEQAAVKETAVRVLKIEPRDIPDMVVLPARIEPASTVVLSAEKPGRVVELRVDKGSAVKAGELLLRLEDSTWQGILARAEVVCRDAERDFARWQEMRKAGSVADSEFDAVAKARDLARVALDQARADAEKCEVRTPIAGIVDDRYVDVGEYAHEGGPVLKIVDISSVKLGLHVPERDVLTVKAGAVVGFSLSSFPGRAFNGEVSFVAAAADPLSNSFRTEVTAPNQDGALRGGMIAEVRIQRGVRKSAIVLPMAAVIPRKGEHIVFVADTGKAERRVVTIDPVSAREAIVLSGLDPGELVVVEGHRSLQDGLPLRVMD